MYKHILVSIDDSQTSQKALDEAISLAKLHGAQLEIAHAVDESLLQTFSSHGVALADARKMQSALLQSGQSTLGEAVRKAEEAGLAVPGAVMASDAFFPFRDTVDLAASYGIRAIIQPGGSVRDQETIEACREHGIALVFTGMRHFRH